MNNKIDSSFQINNLLETPTKNNVWKPEIPTRNLDPPTRTLAPPIEPKPPAESLSLAEWENYNIREPNGPGTYAFGYDIEDPVTGNVQFRNEEKHANGSVTGSYGYLEPDGTVRITHYIADALGYR